MSEIITYGLWFFSILILGLSLGYPLGFMKALREDDKYIKEVKAQFEERIKHLKSKIDNADWWKGE